MVYSQEQNMPVGLEYPIIEKLPVVDVRFKGRRVAFGFWTDGPIIDVAYSMTGARNIFFDLNVRPENTHRHFSIGCRQVGLGNR